MLRKQVTSVLFIYLFLIDVGLGGCNMEVGVGSRLWMARGGHL